MCGGGNAIVNTTYEPGNDDKSRWTGSDTSTWYKLLRERKNNETNAFYWTVRRFVCISSVTLLFPSCLINGSPIRNSYDTSDQKRACNNSPIMKNFYGFSNVSLGVNTLNSTYIKYSDISFYLLECVTRKNLKKKKISNDSTYLKNKLWRQNDSQGRDIRALNFIILVSIHWSKIVRNRLLFENRCILRWYSYYGAPCCDVSKSRVESPPSRRSTYFPAHL